MLFVKLYIEHGFFGGNSHIKAAAKIVHEKYHARGGHFASHESPEALVTDVRQMFARGGPAYGVVKGADGYATRAKL
jgi:hypothetical protein